MPGSYTIGLDLGKARDSSALVVVEGRFHVNGYTEPARFSGGGVEPIGEWHFYARRVLLWQVGTPYWAVVDDLKALCEDRELWGAVLRYDATGVGAAVGELIERAYLDRKLTNPWPEAIVYTAAQHREGWRIPKHDLVAALERVVQERRLHVDPALPLAAKLRQELADFRVAMSATGRATFGARREADHDDLVNALMLALVEPNVYERPRLRHPTGQVVDPLPLPGERAYVHRD